MLKLKEFLINFEGALLTMDRVRAQALIDDLKKNRSSDYSTDEVISTTLERIGDQWETGEVALSQVYMSGRICEEIVVNLFKEDKKTPVDQPNMAIVSLHDFHILGKRIVFSALTASGFDVQDYGQMEVEPLVERVKEEKIGMLLISTLMLPSALRVKLVRQKLKESKLDVILVVGGAPFRFDDQLWKDVEADAMGKNAMEAIRVVKTLIGGEK